MTNKNPCYLPGALWKTRTRFMAKIFDGTNIVDSIIIPRGDLVILLTYEMNQSYEELIVFLWKEKVCFVTDIDSGFSFELDPNNVNTKKFQQHK